MSAPRWKFKTLCDMVYGQIYLRFRGLCKFLLYCCCFSLFNTVSTIQCPKLSLRRIMVVSSLSLFPKGQKFKQICRFACRPNHNSIHNMAPTRCVTVRRILPGNTGRTRHGAEKSQTKSVVIISMAKTWNKVYINSDYILLLIYNQHFFEIIRPKLPADPCDVCSLFSSDPKKLLRASECV